MAFKTTEGQNKFEWNENIKLTVNDFLGESPGPGQTLSISFGTETDLKKEEVQSMTSFNKQVTHYFDRDNSWIDWTDTSRLRYAITLFDLREWMMREYRKRLWENREMVLAGEYAKILEEVRKEFEKIAMDYDVDSESGNNLLVQANWETKVAERLISLSDYCKTCEPKK
jgi:hypothetical protein